MNYSLKFGFENHLKSWTCISYHKNSFSNVFVEKFSRIFKIFSLHDLIDRVYFSTNRNVKKKNSFSFKVLGSFDPSRPIESPFFFFYFFLIYRNHIWLFQKFLFVYLFNSSLNPLSQNFFCRFLGQRFKGFHHTLRARHFCPFFFIFLQVFMQFSLIFLGIFAFLKIWGFWWLWTFWSNLNHGFLFMHHINVIHML